MLPHVMPRGEESLFEVAVAQAQKYSWGREPFAGWHVVGQIGDVHAEPCLIALLLDTVAPATLPLDSYQEKLVFADSLQEQ